MTEDNKPKRVQVESQGLVDQIKQVVEQGNMRRFVVRKADESKLFEVSLTVAVGVAAAIVMFIPAGFFWMLLAVIGGIIAKLRIEILRELTDEDDVVEGEIIQ